MINENFTILFIIFGYLAVVLGIGFFASRKLDKTLDDLFSASKSLGLVALSMGIFGAQLTSFGMMGAPGLAHGMGYSSYGYMFGIGGFASAISYFFVGYRSWIVGKAHGYYTPVQFFEARFDSQIPQVLTGSYQILYEIPYIVIQGIGGGILFNVVTNGMVPYWMGAGIILVVTTTVAYIGGQRGTAWTNIFQGALMLVSIITLVWFVYTSLGGGQEILQSLEPRLLSMGGKGVQQPGQWMVYSFVATGLAFGMMAHILMKNMSADSPQTIKRNLLIFPILSGTLSFIAMSLGVWGSIVFPELSGNAVDHILPMLAEQFAPTWVVGLISAGIFAAIMSTWDGMILTTSSIFTEDIIKPLSNMAGYQWEGGRDGVFSRLFIIALGGIAYVLVLVQPAPILAIATLSFAGFATLFPPYIGVLYWKRTTAWGVIASIIISSGFVAMWAFGILPAWTHFGIHYSGMGLVLSAVILVLVSLVTTPPSDQRIEDFWEPFDDVW